MLSTMARRPKPQQPQAPRSAAEDPLLSEEEARRQLGDISKRQIADMRRLKRISYVRMRSGCRYPQSAVDAYIAERFVRAEP